MGGACGTYKGREMCVCLWFWWGDLKEINHLEDLGVEGRTI